MADKKAVIVTGASRGIGAAVAHAFLDRGYNVVATSRSISRDDFAPSTSLALVDGDIGQADTAQKVAAAAIKAFGTIDHVVNNAGIFYTKPFTEYTAEDFRAFVSTNLEGFLFITQLAVKQMLAQRHGRQRHHHHGGVGRQSHGRLPRLRSDDDERRTEHDYAQPRHGVRRE